MDEERSSETATRRRYLATVGSSVVAGLAGCDGDAGDGSPPPATETPSTTEPPATVGNATATASGSDAGTPATLEGPDQTWDEGGPPDREGWTVTFQDDFAGGGLDWDTWELGFGPASDVPCTASECAIRENVAVEDDRLVLTTTPEGADEIDPSVWVADWTSGAISTASSFNQTFGYFEAKAKIPVQPGSLPAFWAWSDDGSSPEIDFYEVFGTDDRLSLSVPVNCNDDGEHQGRGTRIEPERPVDETFHVIGCEWGPESAVWYLDGEEAFRVDPFWIVECHDDDPVFPILSTYVVDTGDFADSAVAGDPRDADYPYTHEFEWVRVWQHEDWA